MLTIEEKIARSERFAKLCEQAGELPEWREECEQLAAWLRELVERRKMPEIITCGECAHRYVEGNHVRFNRCELNHNNVQSDDWYCGDAERRTDGT